MKPPVLPILQLLLDSPEVSRLKESLEKGQGPAAVFGLHTAHKAHLVAALASERPVLVVTGSDLSAQTLTESIAAFDVPTVSFLARETPLVNAFSLSRERQNARIHVLTRLLQGERLVVVSSVTAFMQRLCPPSAFRSALIPLAVGDTFSPRQLVEKLIYGGYERAELVAGPGQVALRGGLVDVYPANSTNPYRIEFFGDEIDQIRSFDAGTQRSIEQVDALFLPPAVETPLDRRAIEKGLKAIKGKVGFAEQEQSFSAGLSSPFSDVLLPVLFSKLAGIVDYLPENAHIIVDEPHRIDEAAQNAVLLHDELVSAMLERGEGLPEQGKLLLTAGQARDSLLTDHTLTLYTLTRPHPAYQPKGLFSLDARPASVYLGNIGELGRDLSYYKQNEYAVLLYAGEGADRLGEALVSEQVLFTRAERLTRAPRRGEIILLSQALRHGFIYPELRLIAFSESELFGKAEKKPTAVKKKSGLRFSELAVGDYIVHEVHGVGRFVGVEALTVDGKTKDYLNIEYKGGDRLFIPTEQLDRIRKYIGGGDEDAVPPISKLGGQDWTNRVNKVKASAKKLAFDLSRLYAERNALKGFAYPVDNDWQKDFEKSFAYTETPDQLRCIEEIKHDMQSERPMDRLLCGDVGYGKTEVALRAAFKAVQGGKQAAILVPTTILAEQHYQTAVKRFADFPIQVGCLSRFRSTAEKNAIKQGVKEGRIDLLIGTHALLAKDIVFRELGLLIIDEEHRFGVNHKEQIKNIRKSIDVLTLSATPIPRTLNMSMTGIRDISLIETPPSERFPVQSFVMEYSDALMSEAIAKELARGGQVYIVYNRVSSMDTYADKLKKLLPEMRLVTAHGQMPETMLERAMLQFYNHEADVLLASTIIESGLDVPNANTLIVTDADKMGLAQLHQLKGRVGRSTRLGYAYFTVQRDKSLTEKAAKRLAAIREFSSFGAGFQLAMRDLEIRGAGSLLGAEQHGHIADIGYEYYCKLMNNAVREAKGETVEPELDTVIDLPLDAHIPTSFIPNEVQRLYAYRRIADIVTDEDVMDIREELIDRYGDVPLAVENLFLSARVRSLGKAVGLSSILVKDGSAKLVFSEQKKLDGGRLLTALSVQAGTKLIPSAPPSIQLNLPKLDALAITKKLAGFLPSLVDCAER